VKRKWKLNTSKHASPSTRPAPQCHVVWPGLDGSPPRKGCRSSEGGQNDCVRTFRRTSCSSGYSRRTHGRCTGDHLVVVRRTPGNRNEWWRRRRGRGRGRGGVVVVVVVVVVFVVVTGRLGCLCQFDQGDVVGCREDGRTTS